MDMDALVVGCGLSGAVVARQLAESGYKVLIWERRNHIAGNMYDYIDKHGILVHAYGPHTFHTKNKELFDYVCRYGEWEEYKLTCGAEINGICTPTPFNFQTIDDFYPADKADELKKRIVEYYGDRKYATVLEVLQNPDELIRGYAEFLFENDYSLYTAKQWGIKPEEIDPSVLKRVPLRFSYDIGYFDDEFQYMPKKTYTDFFENILEHENITVELETDALEKINIVDNKILIDGRIAEYPIIYTGALDELFCHVLGKLPYRSLRFEWHYENIASRQDMPVVAYPQADGYTRIVEFNKLPVQNTIGTTYEIEYPLPYDPDSDNEPYYPILTNDSMEQYKKYEEMANKVDNLYYCGRLADFKYYNMDQALERALGIANKITKGEVK